MKKAVPYLFIILLLTIGAWYFFTKDPDPVHQLPEELVPPEMPVVSQPEQLTEPDITYPVVEPEPEIVPEPLPPLFESDTAVKQELEVIVGSEPLANYLVKDQAISRMVSTIDSLTARQVPPPINPVRSVPGTFVVETVGDRTVMSEENFARYNAYVDLLNTAETDSILATYRHFYPLFQQAWEENGKRGSFNDRLLEVIDELLMTPDVPGPVYLTKPEAVYLFDNPDLEALSAGQKILIRMGNANASVVKDKLLDIRSRLVSENEVF